MLFDLVVTVKTTGVNEKHVYGYEHAHSLCIEK